MLAPRGKCLPCGKTVISEVHHWDPDTARDTHTEEEEDGVKDGRKGKGAAAVVAGSSGALVTGRKRGKIEVAWSLEREERHFMQHRGLRRK